ncbi:MAG: hypothetical protein HPY45_02735 [Anaerolineae bacterium]|nr:hypothetical protein [Anaerolineae bacterium]
MFDEFSLFLRRYVASRSVGKLQDLLNGISKRQGKSAFLAFTQQDVQTVCETYATGQRLDDVKKELERLPRDKRAELHSLMESVLASYLKQDESAWESWAQGQPVKGFLVRARDSVLDHFGKRYTNDLQWDAAAVYKNIVKGCYPLHPLTTAILAAHSFDPGAGDNPRTVLQFARRAWEEICQCPTMLDGKPNFVYPIHLVDFFGEQISKKLFESYQNALGSPEVLTEEHQKVIKGLFLQEAAKIRASISGGAQFCLLEQLCGLDSQKIKVLLRALVSKQVIQEMGGTYGLWPPSLYNAEMQDILNQATQRVEINSALLEEIDKTLPPFDLSQEFGHKDDWSPKQIVLTESLFTSQEIKKRARKYSKGIEGIEEGVRGLVIWLIAQSEEEKVRLRQKAQNVLDEALKDQEHPLPIVVVLPKQPSSDLIEYARTKKAIDSLSQNEREKIGSLAMDSQRGLINSRFAQTLHELIGESHNYLDVPRVIHEFALPAPYRASVQALPRHSLKTVVGECYRQAYAYRPEFYTQFTVGGKGPQKLRDAAKKVALWLVEDRASNGVSAQSQTDISKQLCMTYLTQKWGLLSPSYTIQPPTLNALWQAWEELGKTFAPGCKDVSVQETLIKLLNPPYGHDYNTLILLFTAWIGYHQHELRLALGGRTVSVAEFKNRLDAEKYPQSFISNICGSTTPLTISRSRPDEMPKEIEQVLNSIRQGETFSQSEAAGALAILQQALAHPRLTSTSKDEVERLLPRLSEAFQIAQEYDQQASDLLMRINSGDLEKIITITFEHLALPTFVIPNQPSVEEIRHRWRTQVQNQLEMFCERFEKLSDLTDYKEHEKQLRDKLQKLKSYPDLAQRLKQALEHLEQQKLALQKRENEKTIIMQIENMKPSVALRDLYEYREALSGFSDLSPETEKLRKTRQDEIEIRIHQYEQIVDVLPTAIEAARTVDDLNKQRDVLLQNISQVEGTPLYQKLQSLQQKIENLQRFFNELNQIDLGKLTTPEDFAQAQAQMEETDKRFLGLLSNTQKQLFQSKKLKIEQEYDRQIQSAQDWLERQEQLFRTREQIKELKSSLENPPSFLSLPEFRDRIQQLRQSVQQKWDQDVALQIEILFLEIADFQTRQKCLERLQQITKTQL